MSNDLSPHDKGKLFVGKLIHVHIRYRVRLLETSLEKVGKFVEFPELPLAKGGVCATADRRRVVIRLLFSIIRTALHEKRIKRVLRNIGRTST